VGAIASAPFACVVDDAPGFSTVPGLAVGHLLVPFPTSAVLEGTLDALGTSQVTLTPAAATPALLGIPIHAQFGVLDAVAGQIRLSNAQIRICQ
jgi:hypothetical protein